MNKRMVNFRERERENMLDIRDVIDINFMCL